MGGTRSAQEDAEINSSEQEATWGRGAGVALKRAFVGSDLRNLLVHGHWWKLDPEEGWIEVRREKLRQDQEAFVRVTVRDIDNAAAELMEVEAALFIAQRAIEETRLRAHPRSFDS